MNNLIKGTFFNRIPIVIL